MRERCADCGFDLAAGKVEVVPTAHYMMGGVEFAADCTTEREGLFVAGEDSGGVHGANRLGGNGVANSTVFGGIAGEAMARSLRNTSTWRDADPDAVEASLDRALRPFSAAGGGSGRHDLEGLRERLYASMWDDAGIVRDDRVKRTRVLIGIELEQDLLHDSPLRAVSRTRSRRGSSNVK